MALDRCLTDCVKRLKKRTTESCTIPLVVSHDSHDKMIEASTCTCSVNAQALPA
ncbi:hypothetical protein Esti_000298 [Eimeria stiedai]